MTSRRLRDARVVPWSSWEEWHCVRELARSDATSQQLADLCGAVWRLRRAAGMPVAAQAEVDLRALVARADDSHAWRLTTGMALVRMVNGLTDRLQPSAAGARARSVRALAGELALPSRLVAVRHQAAHGALPGRMALQAAAEAALAWLDERYWGPQAVASNADSSARELLRAVVEGRARGDETVLLDMGDEDVLARMKKTAGRRIRSRVIEDCEKGSRWRRCGDERRWRNMPLGLCPWQTQVDTGMFEGGKVVRSLDDKAGVDEAHGVKRRKIGTKEIEYVRTMRSILGASVQSAE